MIVGQIVAPALHSRPPRENSGKIMGKLPQLFGGYGSLADTSYKGMSNISL